LSTNAHLDAVQIAILAITDLQSDGAIEPVQPLDFHQVRKNRATMCVEISLGTVQAKYRFVGDDQVQTIAGW
jgi:hypothetical protein